MSDALAVLGSRHGLFFEPHARTCALLRFAAFSDRAPFGLRAGLRIGTREVIFPLGSAAGAEEFGLVDQRTSPAQIVFIGLDAPSGLKVRLSATVPFRLRDPDFSTAPVVLLRLEVEPIGGQFRWENTGKPPEVAEAFIELSGEAFTTDRITPVSIDLLHDAVVTHHDPDQRAWPHTRTRTLPQRDRLLSLAGSCVPPRGPGAIARFTAIVRPHDAMPGHLELAWCTHSPAVLQLPGAPAPFYYSRNFADLDAVAAWATTHAAEIESAADTFAALAADHPYGPCTDHLLAYTFHSWLICTWWTLRPDGRELFTVWEGNCYFHSTVDVEFTQAPFYLVHWPELLANEIDFWTEFTRPGEECLGPVRGAGTRYLSHDCGRYADFGRQLYPHHMEVEETANWLLLVFAHARRTGDLSLARKHAAVLADFVRFLIAADTTGNGVPDTGVANTVDDASPAVQYGKEQTYLGVKTLAALETSAELLGELAHEPALAAATRAQAATLRATIERHAWRGDHFGVLLSPGGTIKDPWTGQISHLDEIPGWDAAHIYTANTLPLLDLVGYDLRLDAARIAQDLVTANRRCMQHYGCAHSDFAEDKGVSVATAATAGLASASRHPGWVSMNITRDLAALRRGLDFSHNFARYWEWQVTTNTRETKLFFETFGGNFLHFYPRGIALWGVHDLSASSHI